MSRQPIRFGMVGLVNTVVDYAVYCVLVVAGVHPQFSNLASVSCAATLSFLGNRIFTFGASQRSTSINEQFSRHAVVSIGAMCLSSLVIRFALPLVGPIPAKALAIPAVFFWSYGLSATWVWPKAEARSSLPRLDRTMLPWPQTRTIGNFSASGKQNFNQRILAPLYKANRVVLDAMGDELRVLIMVGSCDHPLNREEHELIAKYTEIRMSEQGIGVEKSDIDAAIRWAEGRLRDRRAISDCISRLAVREPTALATFGEVCELVAAADGEINSSENDSIAFVRQLIDSSTNGKFRVGGS